MSTLKNLLDEYQSGNLPRKTATGNALRSVKIAHAKDELEALQAKAAKYDALEQATKFIVNNRDKFQEHDPDGVKEWALNKLVKFLDGDK